MEAPLNSCLPPHDKYNFCNALLPEPARLDDLLSRLSLQELVGQLFMNANLAYGNTSITNSSRGDLSARRALAASADCTVQLHGPGQHLSWRFEWVRAHLCAAAVAAAVAAEAPS